MHMLLPLPVDTYVSTDLYSRGKPEVGPQMEWRGSGVPVEFDSVAHDIAVDSKVVAG